MVDYYIYTTFGYFVRFGWLKEFIMKRLLIITLLLLSVGLSQNRVNVNNLVQYGDKYFKENDDKPFNGIVFDLSKETGNKILEYKMIEGLKNGLYQEWYLDGKPKSKGKYLV